MEQNPSSEVDSDSASQKIIRLLWNRRFITVFTKVRHIQSTPSHPISSRSVL